MPGFSNTRRGFLQGSLALSAIGAGSRLAWSQDGKILNLRSRRDLQVLDPGWMIGDMEIDLDYACLGSLAVYSRDGDALSWVPSDFVESVEQVDPLHITFRLRPGMLWTGDFGEVTSEDVKYSFERIANPANEAPWMDKWAALDRVDITDKYSGTIVLKEPFAPLFLTTLCGSQGSILSKAAVEKAGGRFTTEFPAVCGPYVIDNWVPGQRVELVRNPLWTGPQPAFERVNFLIVEDDKSAELAFEAGDADLTSVSAESFTRYKQNTPAGAKLFQGPGTWWIWMGMNTEHPKLQDKRVRQAIQHAVDVDSIILAAYGGLGSRAYGVVPTGLPGHRATTAFAKPDPEKAKALLEEAGATGLSLQLRIMNKVEFLTAAQIIQANLAEIGIDVEVTPMDSGPFWNLGVEAAGEDWRDLQLWIMRFGDAPDPSQMTQWYVSKQVGVWNWERWRDEEFDKLHEAALIESDPQKRSEMYVRMQEIMEDTGAYVWITFPTANVIYRDIVEPVILPPDHPYLPWFKRA